MTRPDDAVFDHERLTVYQRALDLVEAADRFSTRLLGRRRHLGWQLHRAASGAVLNIAEGNGRSTGPDRAHFFMIALGSTLECAAVIDIAERLGIGPAEERGHQGDRQAGRQDAHDPRPQHPQPRPRRPRPQLHLTVPPRP